VELGARPLVEDEHPELPEALWYRIIMLLPASTLVRARAVCRGWTKFVDSRPLALHWGSVTRIRQLTERHGDTVVTCAFAPDSKTLVAVSKERTAHVWATSDWTHRHTFDTGHTNHLTSCSFAPDGTTFVTTCGNGIVRVWATSDWSHLRTLEAASRTHLRTHSAAWLWSCVFAPDGRSLVTTSSALQDSIKVWATEDWSLLRTLKGHTDTVTACAFSPHHGDTLVTVGRNATALVWATQDWTRIHTLVTGHTDTVRSCTFSPEGETFVAASADHTVGVFATRDWSRLRTLTGHTHSVWSAAFSPDGGTLVSVSRDRTVRVWATSSWAHLCTLGGGGSDRVAPFADRSCFLAFAPDGSTVVTSVHGQVEHSALSSANVWTDCGNDRL